MVFHTDSNDVSQIATKTIVTKGSNDINLISYLDQVPFNKDKVKKKKKIILPWFLHQGNI